jgi:hypothetical protein
MTRWRQAHVGRRGDRLMIDGRDVWHDEWRWLNAETVRLPDPCAPGQTLSHSVCEIGPASKPIRFAAARVQGELWSFYVPD